jgi:hypothetical protein
MRWKKEYLIDSEDIDLKNSSMQMNLRKHSMRAEVDLEMSQGAQRLSAVDTRSLIAL